MKRIIQSFSYVEDLALVPRRTYVSIAAYTTYPDSHGKLHITGPNWEVPVDFDPGFFTNPHDVDLKKQVWAYKKRSRNQATPSGVPWRTRDWLPLVFGTLSGSQRLLRAGHKSGKSVYCSWECWGYYREHSTAGRREGSEHHSGRNLDLWGEGDPETEHN
ncbi:uncharacterized protein Z519_00474 [Cladophialophora bantiana CBS 173.52]|uniref:Uncharacterized protein n=1 Tax=Cladophialophora bantiana (strain ATCC 10958 / CBS 173.52 / CDC B-1940 / NIH 8579) TaxID=1442370 RepID=A0A0D2F9Q4_CLAB1|nr:uncharacterized protein Z519_00474 [Cladophialophora bantiana CBS 173.52]KIW98811.1 hypothetical protein Z519_00474 [Cladophialophora bantiana CBS 173.52]